MSALSIILGVVGEIAKAFMATYFADRRIADEANARGRAEGSAETLTLIAETADAQAALVTDSHPDAVALAERLHKRAAADRDRR